MRLFEVGFFNKKNKLVLYPELEGKKALKLMVSLSKKGYKVKARTNANGVEEFLTLKEMLEVVL